MLTNVWRSLEKSVSDYIWIYSFLIEMSIVNPNGLLAWRTLWEETDIEISWIILFAYSTDQDVNSSEEQWQSRFLIVFCTECYQIVFLQERVKQTSIQAVLVYSVIKRTSSNDTKISFAFSNIDIQSVTLGASSDAQKILSVFVYRGKNC
jgi:hypothetical protein